MSELVVPGKWKCDRCGFEVVKTNLYMKTGTTGPDYSMQAEPCPNDGQLLRPMTWKEEAKLGDELIARLWQWHEDAMQVLGMAAQAMNLAAASLARRDAITAPAVNALTTAEHDVRQAIEASKVIPGSPIPELVSALREARQYAEVARDVATTDATDHEVVAFIERLDAVLAKYPAPAQPTTSDPEVRA